MNAIEARNIGKRYLRGEVTSTLKALLSGRNRRRQPFWALHDITINVPEGEVLGIVGENGSGKTTLLSILARITDPTEGYITVSGPVGAMFAGGTGFNFEFTGRENVYDSAQILGLTRSQVDDRFPSIAAFADIGEQMDTPMKRYSEGEIVRVAFSILTALDSPIMLVDDSLASGDMGFKRKCLEHVVSVSRSGKTVLLVSHHMEHRFEEMCHRVLWLRHGATEDLGPATLVMPRYLNYLLKNGLKVHA